MYIVFIAETLPSSCPLAYTIGGFQYDVIVYILPH